MDNYRLILTGATRGLGRKLLEIILTKNPSWQIIATARSNISSFQQKITADFPNTNCKVECLDIGDEESIKKFSDLLKERNFQFDCLVNNAAFGADYPGDKPPSVETAKKTLIPNVLGTIHLTQQLLPLLKPTGRIVHVSSAMGGYSFQSKNIQQRFDNKNVTLEDIEKAVSEYIQGCEKGNVNGFSNSAYCTSKMLVNSYSRYVLAPRLKPPQVSVAMSPGHCETDMSMSPAPRTSVQGANTIYNNIVEERSSDKFYHVDEVVDFYTCGYS